MVFLDTNAVIGVMVQRPPAIAARFDAEVARGTPIFLSTVVLYELDYGARKSAAPERNLKRLSDFLAVITDVVSFDADDAADAGDIRAYLDRHGTPIGPYDLLVAAQARRRGAALVTANLREFNRVPGLMVVDWGA